MSNGLMMGVSTPMSPLGRSCFRVEPRHIKGSGNSFVLDAVPCDQVTTSGTESESVQSDLVAIWQAYLTSEEQVFFGSRGFGSSSGPGMNSPLFENASLPSERDLVTAVAVNVLASHEHVSSERYLPTCPPSANGFIGLAADVLASLDFGDDDVTPQVARHTATPKAVRTCPERLGQANYHRSQAKLRFAEDFCWRLLTARMVRATPAQKKRLGRPRRRAPLREHGSQCGELPHPGAPLEVSEFCLLVVTLSYVALEVLIKIATAGSLKCLATSPRSAQCLTERASEVTPEMSDMIIVSAQPQSVGDLWAAFCDVAALFSRQPPSPCDETLLLQVACLTESQREEALVHKAVCASREVLMAKWVHLMSLVCPSRQILPFPASHRLLPFRDIVLGMAGQNSPRALALQHHLLHRLLPYFQKERGSLRHRSTEPDQMPVAGDLTFLLLLVDGCVRLMAHHTQVKQWLADSKHDSVTAYLSSVLAPADDPLPQATTTPNRKLAHQPKLELPKINATESTTLNQDCRLCLDLVAALCLTNTSYLTHVKETAPKVQCFRIPRETMISLLDRFLLMFALGLKLDESKAILVLDRGMELVRSAYLLRASLHAPQTNSAQTSGRRRRCGCLGPCAQELSPVCGSQMWTKMATEIAEASASQSRPAAAALRDELTHWERTGLAWFPPFPSLSGGKDARNSKRKNLLELPAFVAGIVVCMIVFLVLLSFSFAEQRSLNLADTRLSALMATDSISASVHLAKQGLGFRKRHAGQASGSDQKFIPFMPSGQMANL